MGEADTIAEGPVVASTVLSENRVVGYLASPKSRSHCGMCSAKTRLCWIPAPLF